jgi:DNA-binding transcriptional MerR regulator/methylmalonyl-CoA mutase cobalamin-binding subunit
VPEARLRIGELARRSGVSPELLRAWERRYGLLEPVRTDGGYRLYSEQDEARVATMRAHLANGMSAAQAAQLARTADVPGSAAGDLAGDLWAALDGFDDAGAQAAFDRLFAAFSFETIARTAVLPYLQALGERWRDGDASVAQEHFASAVLRGRLLGLARGWDRGLGPRALLACPPGERHDLGLVIFGLALRDRGWRVTYLGPDTPIETIEAAAETLAPDVVILCALTPEHFEAAREPIASLARRRRVCIGGAGAGADLARGTGTHLLAGDPLTTAAQLSG